MIDREVIDAKADHIDNRLSFLEEKQETFDPETSTETELLAIEKALQEAIEACLDISNHIISMRSLGSPTDYSAYFTKLRRDDVIDEELTDRLQDMAKFRNVLVHLYDEISRDRIHTIINDDLDDIRQFLTQVYNDLDEDE